ncbi:MAG TPA: hypothetical protein PLY93_11965 [Turneriella sp.]|nr:hypothetical protein [Turneriella sp.]
MKAAYATVEKVRTALIEAAKTAYEEAGMMGLCAEGRWENALGAMQSISLNNFFKKSATERGKSHRAVSDTPRSKRAIQTTTKTKNKA